MEGRLHTEIEQFLIDALGDLLEQSGVYDLLKDKQPPPRVPEAVEFDEDLMPQPAASYPFEVPCWWKRVKM